MKKLNQIQKRIGLLLLLIVILIIVFVIYSYRVHSYQSNENFSNNVFNEVYQNKVWGTGEISGGSSGPGSSPELNKKYIEYLNDFIQKNNIKSIVDIGCGDWQIMSLVNLDNVQYYGYDTSSIIIDANNKKYKRKNINFIYNDLDQAVDFKAADLLICKDVLQHLSYHNIHKILLQLHKYKHFFIIGNTGRMGETTVNRNIKDGGCRDLDIRNPPFNVQNLEDPKYLWAPERPDMALLTNN